MEGSISGDGKLKVLPTAAINPGTIGLENWTAQAHTIEMDTSGSLKVRVERRGIDTFGSFTAMVWLNR